MCLSPLPNTIRLVCAHSCDPIQKIEPDGCFFADGHSFMGMYRTCPPCVSRSAVITAQSINPVAHSTHQDGPEMNYLSVQLPVVLYQNLSSCC